MSAVGPNRRELLSWSAAVAAAGTLASAARARRRAPDLAVPDLDETLRWIVVTPRDPALRRGARELQVGLDAGALLGALLVAAAHEIRTDRASFNHAALVVSSLDQLGAGASRDERRVAALWCLDAFKEAQEAEAATDDWRLRPVDAAKLPSGAAARKALIDALERWDREAADPAIAGYVRSAPLDEVFALVWEYGPRCRANIGHKAIYAALSRRALPLAGERYAEDVLRSVVASFFLDGRTAEADAFEQSRALVAPGIVRGRALPASELGPAHELLDAMRSPATGDPSRAAARLLRSGADPGTLWDAVVVAASEISVANTGVGPLHAFTSTNALHHIALHAPDARVADLALLQAAAWVGRFRAGLAPEAAALRIDRLAPAECDAASVLSGAAPGATELAQRALWVGAHDPCAFLELALALARTKADDIHEFKLAAAAIEESRRLGAWARPYAIAALSVHLPPPQRADGERLQRVREALAAASPQRH